MTDRWFAPKDICFTIEQVIWLLENLSAIREGNWPPRPSGYVEPKIYVKHGHHAYYEVPVMIAAELLVRLENAGQDGAMARMLYVYGEDEGAIARHWHTTSDIVTYRINRALRYCSGWKRRRAYEQRKNTVKGVIFSGY